MGAFEGDRRAEPSKQWRAAAQQNRDHVHADLIDQAERECLLQMVRRADELVARRALGLLNRADDAVGDEGLHGWVPRGRLVVGDNEARVSPTGPLSPQPPSPSFLSNPLRPITMAPTPASISCRMARSSSVAASNIQSCSIPAPSPNGFSRLSFGPLTYPSSEVELSKITSVRSASSLCCLLTDPNSSHLHRRRPAALLIGHPPDQVSAVGPAPASHDERSAGRPSAAPRRHVCRRLRYLT